MRKKVTCKNCGHKNYLTIKTQLNFEKILKLEGLRGWKMRWDTGGGLCNYNNKEIWMGPKKYSAPLFLHEVAHALCPKEVCGNCWVNIDKCWRSHNNGHNAIWGDCYTGLVKKYLLHKEE